MGEVHAFTETAVRLDGSQGPMFGVFAQPGGECHAAILLVAGQPQTRVGSHRMFVDLARMLAAQGIAILRFDVGGWGDSPGEPLPFERSDRDIAAAAAFLVRQASAPLWLWGLCDGASAAALALPALRAHGLAPRAICLVNPWVRSEASLADAMVKTYYARRVFEREFWRRLLTGQVSLHNLVVAPWRALIARLGAARGARDAGDHGTDARNPAAKDLPELILEQLAGFDGRVLTVLSGGDLTAGETESLIARDARWRERLERTGELLRVPGADHTFSDPGQWESVARWIAERARQA